MDSLPIIKASFGHHFWSALANPFVIVAFFLAGIFVAERTKLKDLLPVTLFFGGLTVFLAVGASIGFQKIDFNGQVFSGGPREQAIAILGSGFGSTTAVVLSLTLGRVAWQMRSGNTMDGSSE
ncbi:hypothetical protein [uncultured Roseobacter sp.]|uniref:hypothetical protein n=1 Tax=uncultured Roseobacter sp. TaxID=114847 RepID=UPI00261CB75E|nr:hypothetical protein [uncultured Roseobacter sp.]